MLKIVGSPDMSRPKVKNNISEVVRFGVSSSSRSMKLAKKLEKLKSKKIG